MILKLTLILRLLKVSQLTLCISSCTLTKSYLPLSLKIYFHCEACRASRCFYFNHESIHVWHAPIAFFSSLVFTVLIAIIYAFCYRLLKLYYTVIQKQWLAAGNMFLQLYMVMLKQPILKSAQVQARDLADMQLGSIGKKSLQLQSRYFASIFCC